MGNRRGNDFNNIGAIVMTAAFVFALPVAHAQDRAPPARPESGPMIQEGDAQLLFSYLREALRAAAEGRDPPPAGALEKRSAEIADTLKRRSEALARGLLDEAERSAREALRELESRREPRRPLPQGHQAI
jgi:hypothetical protein